MVKDVIVEMCASQVCPRQRADEAERLKYFEIQDSMRQRLLLMVWPI